MSDIRFIITIENVEENKVNVGLDKCLSHLMRYHTKRLTAVDSLEREREKEGRKKESNGEKGRMKEKI